MLLKEPRNASKHDQSLYNGTVTSLKRRERSERYDAVADTFSTGTSIAVSSVAGRNTNATFHFTLGCV